MRRLLNLDDRLSLCAEFVRSGARLADIGTDHAYLPVWLAVNGKISYAVASDVRPLPLERGRENIVKYKVEDKVAVRLSDGLNKISDDEVDDIVIAGMGGELICDILRKALWVKSRDKHLILQPMTRANLLREYLYSSGYIIDKEKACVHNRKNYSVISAYFVGESIGKEVEPYKLFIGELDMNDTLSVEYAKNILKKLSFKRDGLIHDGKSTEGIDCIITKIKEMCGSDNG